MGTKACSVANPPVGYTVVAHTVTSPQSTNVIACPFGSPEARLLPHADLDPRFANTSSASSSTQPTLVQIARYHMRLDDGKAHPIVSLFKRCHLLTSDRRQHCRPSQL